jgi:hypothetical protein
MLVETLLSPAVPNPPPTKTVRVETGQRVDIRSRPHYRPSHQRAHSILQWKDCPSRTRLAVTSGPSRSGSGKISSSVEICADHRQRADSIIL